ncbi:MULTISPECIES: Uma2 family endonuclease [Roseofilum]|uniref:Uma2 family endonuclease n=2 Tax=Roseofilum TaxID=1233426 RepID=A0ABT7BDG2_9CYAN|nr:MULTISPECIES: Uma2 family endonuclease [Roseofilum]MDJ1171179.1 Uma2 family endonuclease [Roseofilum acuticapitatum BLCC-M154]MDJ1177228.1 Uma2 family endonuclease [Roseofilum capinflatum BLCC-M114]
MVITPSSIEANPNAVLVGNLTWDKLETLDAGFVGTGARLTYLDGYLQIMSPLSEAHEEPKKTLSQLLEAYLRVKNIRFYARGSTTLGSQDLGGRKEPDESYCLHEKKSIPDLAIEIVLTSGGIDSLEVYRRVGVPEVWFWEDGAIAVYSLQSTEYRLVKNSELLPDLDLRSLELHSRMADQYDAVNEFVRLLM